jgi:UDP-N-acetylglucosamine 2-epimerase (non-hydrolysing)/UDP-GlcNAc3NAcA epimerase
LRVLTVIGNRPQFIKAAAVTPALRRHDEEILVHTGQHFDDALSSVFFEELGLPAPDRELGVAGGSNTSQTARMLAALEPVIAESAPDCVLVYGDTNSTLAGAQAAGATPVAHVEAGLRSFDLAMPEERNRIAVDRISALLLCPDERSATQLESEGVAGRREVVGDVMADANRIFAPIARARSTVLETLGVTPGGYVLVTVHREANVTLERLTRIAAALDSLELPLVFPAHPRTRAALEDIPHRFAIVEPLGFLEFASLAAQARVILTDSGGVQKEAYWYRVPCVTMRPSTEWVDTVAAGANVLADDDPEAIVEAVAAARFPDSAPQLYGDGHASEQIAAALYASRP